MADDVNALAAKYGVAVAPAPPSSESDPKALAARYGVAVQEPSQDGSTGSAKTGNTDTGIHPLDVAGHAIANWWDQIHHGPMNLYETGKGLAGLATGDTEKAMGSQNAALWKKAKDAYDKKDYTGAAAHALNYVMNGIPGVGAALDDAGESFKNGDVSGGVGKTLGIATNLATPMAVPRVMAATGRGMQATAAPIAESAIGVRAMDRAYGKTPGAAALEETSGLTPSAVAESARDRLAILDPQLEAAARNAPGTASLTPARNVIDTRIQQAQAGNSTYVPPVGRGRVPELGQMRQQLTEPGPNFAGVIDPATGEIAADQSPLNILRMKREFGKDFTRWNQQFPQSEMKTARQVYRALDQEFDNAVPGGAELNQRTSSLIPIAERAEATDLQTGIVPRLIHKASAHTGALIGADAGYRAGGIPGAIAGFVIPEIAASPAGRMAMARALYGTGRALRNGAAGRAATGTTATGLLVNPYRDPRESQILALSDAAR